MHGAAKLALLLVAVVILLGIDAAPLSAAAAWKCGKKHCFWTEGYTGPVPDYARTWLAPSGPGCYYVLRAKSKWVEYCPPAAPMQ